MKISVFKPLIQTDRKCFEPFRYSNHFGDTAFSLLYAWCERFDYGYRLLDDVLLIAGKGAGGHKVFSLIRSKPDCSIDGVLRELCKYCLDCGILPVLEYISGEELEDYIHAAHTIGRKIAYSYQDRYSDYIYDSAEFISMAGERNKTKRGGYNYLLKHYPDIRYVNYNAGLYADCIGIFESWCSAHDCRKCYYGCERRAFERFMEIYDGSYHRIGMTYVGNKPLSFAVCEQINGNTVSCYFQKNAERIRGLTYWLSRQMAMEDENIKYMNLGEDMGLQGLITDKMLLRPCRIMKKYTAVIL